jgi:hypothetical protein
MLIFMNQDVDLDGNISKPNHMSPLSLYLL